VILLAAAKGRALKEAKKHSAHGDCHVWDPAVARGSSIWSRRKDALGGYCCVMGGICTPFGTRPTTACTPRNGASPTASMCDFCCGARCEDENLPTFHCWPLGRRGRCCFGSKAVCGRSRRGPRGLPWSGRWIALGGRWPPPKTTMWKGGGGRRPVSGRRKRAG